MFLVFYFKNLPGCLLISGPATAVPRALLPRHASPSPTPPELRRCVAAVLGSLSRGIAPATDHCYRSRDLAPEARVRRPSPSWGLPSCAAASPLCVGHCVVCRAVADVDAVVVDRGGQRPDPRALPPSGGASSRRGRRRRAGSCPRSARGRVPPLWWCVGAVWPSPSPSCGVLPSIGARRRRSWSRVRLATLTVSWLFGLRPYVFGGSWFLLTISLANF